MRKPTVSVDELAEAVGDTEGVQRDDDDPDELLAELREPAAVQQTFHAAGHDVRREESDEQRADDAADQVHADDVERVVVAELVLPAHRVRADEAGDETDDDRAEHVTGSARRGDRDQAGDDARRGAERRGVAVALLLDEQPAQQTGAAGDEGVEEDLRRRYRRRQARSRR